MIIDEDALAHYGTPRHSGRYPWGSGGEDTARNRDFLGMLDHLKKQGLSEPEIAKAMGFASLDKEGNLRLKSDGKPFSNGTTQLRVRRTIALNAVKAERAAQVEKLAAKGMGATAIARQLGLKNESVVRALLAPGQKEKNAIIDSTRTLIRDAVKQKGLVDVSAGAEHLIGVSRSKFDAAIMMLHEEGYITHYVQVPQLGTSHDTNMKVLSKPGVTYSQVLKKRDTIDQIGAYSEDGGSTFTKIVEPTSISSKRVAVKWKEDGGDEADGMIYVRPGVHDTSLGASHYAQVRVAVDGTHFLKGMAIYKDDLPKGVDLEFHTAKSRSSDKHDAMKAMKQDAEGRTDFLKSVTRQHGVMNIVNEEGFWEGNSHNLSSQMMSKQPLKFAKQQLDVNYEQKKKEFDAIKLLTNPVVRRKLLEEFSDAADKSAVDLEAAGLKGTSTQVILPLSKIKPTEIYAPNYKQGERVALVRHPHGGIFEIPDLVVNNNNPAAKKAFGNLRDAVGIHYTVAKKLSGADFDGDTVLVIPNNRGQVKHAPALDSLMNFEPKETYRPYEGMRTIDGGIYKNGKVDYGGKQPSGTTKQAEMGKVSNLITDMTIRGASHEEIARAIKHSMVVIDAEKHVLNYKQSELDFGIKELKRKWQAQPGKKTYGASTIVSAAGARVDIRERKQLVKTDPKTGRLLYTETGKNFIDKNTGKTVWRTQRVERLAITDNAHDLVGKPPTPIELVYADHSNRLKALANEARKVRVNTTVAAYNPSAKKVYAKEAASLKAKLLIAKRNAPLERQAQIVGNALYKARLDANPNMDRETKKKIKGQMLDLGRHRTGATKIRVDITQEEWNAIQAGAISSGMLSDILDNANMKIVRDYATPKRVHMMTTSKTSRARTMLTQGYTQADVAAQLGVSLTTLKVALKEG